MLTVRVAVHARASLHTRHKQAHSQDNPSIRTTDSKLPDHPSCPCSASQPARRTHYLVLDGPACCRWLRPEDSRDVGPLARVVAGLKSQVYLKASLRGDQLGYLTGLCAENPHSLIQKLKLLSRPFWKGSASSLGATCAPQVVDLLSCSNKSSNCRWLGHWRELKMTVQV